MDALRETSLRNAREGKPEFPYAMRACASGAGGQDGSFRRGQWSEWDVPASSALPRSREERAEAPEEVGKRTPGQPDSRPRSFLLTSAVLCNVLLRVWSQAYGPKGCWCELCQLFSRKEGLSPQQGCRLCSALAAARSNYLTGSARGLSCGPSPLDLGRNMTPPRNPADAPLVSCLAFV